MDNPKINTYRMWEHLNNAQLIRYLLLFVRGWAIVQVLAYFETVLIVFILAATLAFLLNYPVKFVSGFIPRLLAVVVAFLFALLIDYRCVNGNVRISSHFPSTAFIRTGSSIFRLAAPTVENT
ncbi:hypothetical protein QUA30_27640 [Microcoleus sp. Pol14C2]|uniref:hypothetical protein n=1 Tax=unclassified Microcoleus TaxID=2642155 RepID=UPI002FD3ECF2